MSGFRDRLRRAAGGVGQALGGRPRPGVELVRVDQPNPPSPPPPRPLRALPPPGWPVCRRCGHRHEPRPIPGRDGTGLAALYGQQVVPDPNRPQALGRDADETPLLRDRFRPWSGP